MAEQKTLAALSVKIGVNLDQLQTGLEKAQQGLTNFASKVQKIGGVMAAVFAAESIYAFGKELVNMAIEGEAALKKAQTVLGDYYGDVETLANTTAHSLGLTTGEFVDAATAAADLLIPMGFARDEAAKMSTDLVGLSGALSEWSNGKQSAQQVSETLTKAMLGERDGLKALGIAISETDVQNRLAAKGQKNLTGSALEQAKAIATLELVMEKSADAQTAFANNSDSLIRQQAIMKANFAELKDTLADALIPVLHKITGWIAEALPYLTKGFSEAKTAIVDVANYFIDLYNNSELFRNSIQTAIFVFKSLWATAIAGLKNMISYFAQYGNLIKAVLTGNFSDIPDIIQKGMTDRAKIATELGEKWVDYYKTGVENTFNAKKIELIKSDDIKSEQKKAFDGGVEIGKSLKNGIQTGSGGGYKRQSESLVSTPASKTGAVESPITPAFLAEYKQNIEEVKSLTVDLDSTLQSSVSDMVVSLSESFGEMLSGTGTFDSFLTTLLTGLLDFGAQVGKVIIGVGVANLALKSAFANPFAAIAAGGALVALTAVAKNLMAKGVSTPALANGGLAYGPTLALVGDNKGARSNPEVIAPLDKLNQIFAANSGGGGGAVEFYISGKNLKGVLTREDKRLNATT